MKKISVSLLVFNEKHNLEQTIVKAYQELEKLYLNFDEINQLNLEKLLFR